MILDINFQFGEFLSESNSILDWTIQLVCALIGAAATVYATWWLFRNTLGSQINQENERRIKEQTEKIKYLSTLIASVKTDMKLHIEYIQKFVLNIETNPFVIPELSQTSNQDVKRLVNRINQAEYFHAYMFRFNDEKKFAEIYQQLDYYDVNIESVRQFVASTRNFDYSRQREYQEIFFRLRKIMNDIARTNPYNFTLDAVAKIREILSGISDGEKFIGIKKVQDNFISPALKYLQTIEGTDEILHLLQRANDLYLEIEKKNLDFASNMRTEAANLQKSLDTLSTSSATLFN